MAELSRSMFQAWGKAGGLRGNGKALKALSKRARRERAKRAATARWSKWRLKQAGAI